MGLWYAVNGSTKAVARAQLRRLFGREASRARRGAEAAPPVGRQQAQLAEQAATTCRSFRGVRWGGGAYKRAQWTSLG